MNENEMKPRPAPCPRCQRPMRPALVKTAMWYDERVVLVENVPAMVCDSCVEQFYDDEITEALTRVTEHGFAGAEQTGEILVPVYTLKRRTRSSEKEVVWPSDST